MNDLIDIQPIVDSNPIIRTLERFGLKFSKHGTEHYAKCPFHADGKRGNLRASEAKNAWTCDVCGVGGGVIQFVMRFEKVDFSTACERLGGVATPKEKAVDVSKSPVAVYNYEDETGTLLYQVCRYQTPNPEKDSGYDKTFRQRHPGPTGSWVWSMENVRRVPYRLPSIIQQFGEIVNITEGEKDADTLAKLGFLATCNVGGAGKWLLGYGDFLTGRDVAIWPDNDEPGRNHAKDVFAKLASKAKTIRMMAVPPAYKDLSEWLQTIPDDIEKCKRLMALHDSAVPLYGGVSLPFLSVEECEPLYAKQARASDTMTLDISKWLPGLGVRGLVPGELAVVIAPTGVGKTAFLSNLTINTAPLPAILFELELPYELTFERLIATATGTKCADVFDAYRMGHRVDWKSGKPLDHVHICCEANIAADDIERMIDKAELKTGVRPVLAMVDYIQLLKGTGRNRYERTSENAERMKTIAKRTGTILFFASQVNTRGDEDPEVGLHDAKDSGSIENSCGLVLGAWKTDPKIMRVKVLKNTKGRPGREIDCDFDGERMIISEHRAKIDPEDVPLPFEQ